MSTLKDAENYKELVIKDITDDSVYETMTSQGFSVGSEVKIISKLPFNGAITCESNQTRFAIRAEDAAHIVVID
jgi:Fe2+ transport system protein FeoA